MSSPIEKRGEGSDVESQLEAGRQMTIQLSQAQFEKLYMSSHQPKGDLSKRFANPTPLGLVCFCVPLTTLSCYLLEFHGTSAASVPVAVGAFYFVGGLGQTLCGLLEFFLGNTFPFVVFVSFSGLYYSFGYINDVNSHIAEAFGGEELAEHSVAKLHGMALYLSMWTAMLGVYTLICLRLNVVYTVLFGLVTIGVGLMSGAYYALGDGLASKATTYLQTAGGFMLGSCICGWYLVLIQLLESVDFMYTFPVGDLSKFMAKKKSKDA